MLDLGVAEAPAAAGRDEVTSALQRTQSIIEAARIEEDRGGRGVPDSTQRAVATDASLHKSVHSVVICAIAFGFDTPGDEGRYERYVSDSYHPVVQSWLVCGTILFVVYFINIVKGRIWFYLLVTPWNSLPLLSAAWSCFAAPHRWHARRERFWMAAFIGRMGARLMLLTAHAGQTGPARVFMERYGDVISGVVLPQSAEWVRERHLVIPQLIDVVINTVVYSHVGLHGGVLWACFLHGLAKTALGAAMNVAIEYWTRRSFLLAVQRKRQ